MVKIFLKSFVILLHFVILLYLFFLFYFVILLNRVYSTYIEIVFNQGIGVQDLSTSSTIVET